MKMIIEVLKENVIYFICILLLIVMVVFIIFTVIEDNSSREKCYDLCSPYDLSGSTKDVCFCNTKILRKIIK